MEGMRVFYFVHHEGRQDAADGVDGPEHVEDEFIVVLHVRCVDFEQIVVFAGDIVTLGHLRDILDDGHEFPGDFTVHLLQLHRAEDDESQMELFRVQDGDVLADHAAALQALEPLENGGGGQMDPGGQFLGGEAGVFLHAAQDVEVDGVEQEVIHGKEYYSV